MTVIRSGSASHVGRVRTVNEDRLLESVALFAVADGMGGHAGGEVAAGLAIEVLQRRFAADPTARGLVEAVRAANRVVFDRSLEDSEVRGMGTTLAAAALVPTEDGDRLVVVNVGDSRVYRYRDGQLEQMTTDHSVAEELVARGELSEAEAAVHPQRHILTRALGVAPEVDVDAWELAPAEGERFLLCSDGLTNEVGQEQIATVLAEVPDPQAVADRLVAMANQHGGSDNVTVVVVDVLVADPPSPEELASGRAREARVLGAGPAARPSSSAGPEVGSRERGAPSGFRDPGWRSAAGEGSVTGVLQVEDLERHLAVEEVADENPATEEPVTLGRHVAGALDDALRSRPRDRGATRPAARWPERRITVRVVLFLVLLAAVVVGGWVLVRFYAEGEYFVGLQGDRVVVEQGRPGGFLGFEPHVVDRTGLTSAEVLAYRVPELRSGVIEPSRAAADRFVANLQAEACSVRPNEPICPRQSGADRAGSVGTA
ncbi:Stp1/IreP family PP2C-type Ser/Thr phosphatase [Aciditerrimonas ferrireducens]|uniref:Stp1/IreP family PP2C-type Ser/Thr phosphatase n=1 Tax=Aciditerrimonas ferrireducens TaxID=667306 RepID=A0ABV6C574_9ACTN